mgnify:CR=1 FL=1
MPKVFKITQTVDVPKEVDVKVDGLKVLVSGPLGRLEKDFSHARGIQIRLQDNHVIIEAFNPRKREQALVGTIAGHIKNMIKGVTKGFKYKLKIVYAPVSYTHLTLPTTERV